MANGQDPVARDTRHRLAAAAEPSPATLTTLALAVGIVGGIYGIGGGSLLGPILAACGLPMARLAPAALAATFATSLLGARFQRRLPETPLRLLLGTLATSIGTLHAIQALV